MRSKIIVRAVLIPTAVAAAMTLVASGASAAESNTMPLPVATASHQSPDGVTSACTLKLSGTISGAQTVIAGERLCLRDATVDGAVTVQPGGAISVRRTTINGALIANSATGFKFCGSHTVGGEISAIGGNGLVLIGDDVNCSPNTVDGALNVSDNLRRVTIGVTTVSGAVSVNNNSAAIGNDPRIYANIITGSLSCNANVPAPINLGRSNSVIGARSGQCIAEDF